MTTLVTPPMTTLVMPPVMPQVRAQEAEYAEARAAALLEQRQIAEGGRREIASRAQPSDLDTIPSGELTLVQQLEAQQAKGLTLEQVAADLRAQLSVAVMELQLGADEAAGRRASEAEAEAEASGAAAAAEAELAAVREVLGAREAELAEARAQVARAAAERNELRRRSVDRRRSIEVVTGLVGGLAKGRWLLAKEQACQLASVPSNPSASSDGGGNGSGGSGSGDGGGDGDGSGGRRRGRSSEEEEEEEAYRLQREEEEERRLQEVLSSLEQQAADAARRSQLLEDGAATSTAEHTLSLAVARRRWRRAVAAVTGKTELQLQAQLNEAAAALEAHGAEVAELEARCAFSRAKVERIEGEKDAKEEALERAHVRNAKLEAKLCGVGGGDLAAHAAASRRALKRRLERKQARLRELAGAIRNKELEADESGAAEESRSSTPFSPHTCSQASTLFSPLSFSPPFSSPTTSRQASRQSTRQASQQATRQASRQASHRAPSVDQPSEIGPPVAAGMWALSTAKGSCEGSVSRQGNVCTAKSTLSASPWGAIPSGWSSPDNSPRMSPQGPRPASRQAGWQVSVARGGVGSGLRSRSPSPPPPSRHGRPRSD